MAYFIFNLNKQSVCQFCIFCIVWCQFDAVLQENTGKPSRDRLKIVKIGWKSCKIAKGCFSKSKFGC
jgi:hypothetical protein